jgi:hypothetical protein
MSAVSKFDILKEMARRNLDIRAFPMSDNLAAASADKTNGRITLLVNPETIMDMVQGKPLIGVLFIADGDQFEQVQAELERVNPGEDR